MLTEQDKDGNAAHFDAFVLMYKRWRFRETAFFRIRTSPDRRLLGQVLKIKVIYTTHVHNIKKKKKRKKKKAASKNLQKQDESPKRKRLANNAPNQY